MQLKPILFCLVFSAFIVYACSKSDVKNTDPCEGIAFNITHTFTPAIGSNNDGTISIQSPRGDTVSYKLNNGSFQDSWYFTNLAPGSYVVTIKNQKGCLDTTQITIPNYGPKYAAVKQLISGGGGMGYCGPCHLNGGNDGSKNFDTDANILANWDRIKARAADNIPTPMPPAPNSPLTPPDKQKIIDWVNAGHRISD